MSVPHLLLNLSFAETKWQPEIRQRSQATSELHFISLQVEFLPSTIINLNSSLLLKVRVSLHLLTLSRCFINLIANDYNNKRDSDREAARPCAFPSPLLCIPSETIKLILILIDELWNREPVSIYLRTDYISRLSYHGNILINRLLWKLEASFGKLKLEHCCTVFSKHDLQPILGV